MQTSIIFVTAKSKEIGIGHFSRIRKIAEACSNSFLMDATLWLLSGRETEQEMFNRTVNEEHFGKIFELDPPPEYIVFDLHSSFIDEDFKSYLRLFTQNNIKIIGIDCSLELASVANIIWIPSFYIKPELRLSLPPNVIYGWDTYFNKLNHNQKIWSSGEHVLVLTGGSDVTKQGDTLPSLIENTVEQKMIIDWVKGPYSDMPLIPENSKHHWVIHHAPTHLSHLIEATNYAVSLYGVSLFELISNGIPTAVFSPYPGRDDSELKELSSKGICLVSKDACEAVENLSLMIQDKEKSLELSKNSLLKLNQSGLEKIVKVILNMKRSMHDEL